MTCDEELKYYEKALVEFTYRENNFDKIPPIVGVLFADLFGNAIMTYEFENNSSYGSIKSYLSDNNKSLLEIDLVSMYFSSFSIFASNNNIRDLSYLEIHGSNLKIQISFLFDKFMIIIFLNSNTILTLKTQEEMLKHFKALIKNHWDSLVNFNKRDSKEIIRELKKGGLSWLIKLNKNYIQDFKKGYLMKTDYIENFINKINPIIEDELKEYLQNVPEDIIIDLLREIKNKIQNEIFELASKLVKR
jgi:hypothetical protein